MQKFVYWLEAITFLFDKMKCGKTQMEIHLQNKKAHANRAMSSDFQAVSATCKQMRTSGLRMKSKLF